MKEWKDVQCLLAGNISPAQMCQIRTEYSMKWYVENANLNKWIYYIFSIIGILCPLVNAVCVVCCNSQCMTVLLSSVTSLSVSVLALTNAKSKWENYRSAAEFLKREYVLFRSGAGVYEFNNSGRAETYLQTIEDYMQMVHVNWQKIFDKENSKKQGK